MTSSKENSRDIKALLEKLEQNINKNDKALARLILKSIAKRPKTGRNKLIDSLIIRLSNQHEITMHGRHIKDILGITSAKENKSFNAHPYRMAKAAAVSTVIWRDKKGRPYILLGHKKPSMTNPTTGTQYILPGGYMDPAPLEGGDFSRKFDKSLKDSMLRELQEETGLIPPKSAPTQLIEHHSTHGKTDHINAHSIVSAWLVDLGQNGTNPPPVVAGDDLAVVTWVRADRITKTEGSTPDKFGETKTHWRAQVGNKWLPIREMDGKAAEDGLRIIRDKELSEHGFSKETLLTALKKADTKSPNPKNKIGKLQKLLGKSPKSEFGKDAEIWHKRSLEIAALLRSEISHKITGIETQKPKNPQIIPPSNPASVSILEEGTEVHYKGPSKLSELRKGKISSSNKSILAKLANKNNISDKDLLNIITKSIDKRGQNKNPIIESLIVALGNQRVGSIHGREFHDNISGDDNKSRKSYNLLPYRDPGGNAVGVPLYQDDKGEIFVLLGRKKPAPIAKGYDQILVLSGGYMDRAPLKDGKSLKKQPFDKSLEETLKREMAEETGIDINNAQEISQNGLRALHNTKGNERAHNVVADYLIDFGIRNTAPTHKAADDMAELDWVKLSDIRKLPAGKELKVPNFSSNYAAKMNGKEYPLRKFHCQMLEDGIKNLRIKALKEKGITRKGAEALARDLEKAEGKAKYSLMPKAPKTEIGKEAKKYHNSALKMAAKMQKLLENNANIAKSINAKLQKNKSKQPPKPPSNWGGNGPR